MSVAFDTLKFARALREKANMSAEQAEGVAEAFSGATSEQLATKADLDKLGADLRAEIAETRSELGARISAVDNAQSARSASLEASLSGKIARVESEMVLLKWMVGFALAMLVAVFGKLFLR